MMYSLGFIWLAGNQVPIFPECSLPLVPIHQSSQEVLLGFLIIPFKLGLSIGNLVLFTHVLQ